MSEFWLAALALTAIGQYGFIVWLFIKANSQGGAQ
jgi:nitrate reductase NapE component